MSRRPCLLVFLVALLVAAGCSTSEQPTDSDARICAHDIDALAGPAWTGTLTYVDYESGRRTTIDSSFVVRRVGESPPAWEFGVGYSTEPHADAREVVALSSDGRSLGDERVILRESLPDGGVQIVTESDGEDDGRAARFRFEHTVTPREYTRRKLVRFDGDSEFFERHTYRWTR